jgi:hypothetical protein
LWLIAEKKQAAPGFAGGQALVTQSERCGV